MAPTSTIKAGDRVKVIGVPANLHDKNDLRTRSLFEKWVGAAFEVLGFEYAEGLDVLLIRLDVGHVLGKKSWEDTIWIEPPFVEIVSA